MILYHFCAAHMVDAIMREGLTLGQYPIFDGADFRSIPRCQWLTAEKEPKKQSWATRILVPYSRTAYRLTVDIPTNYRKKIYRAVDFAMVLPAENRGIVTDWDGSDQWYIYKGNIPPKWIVGRKKMA